MKSFASDFFFVLLLITFLLVFVFLKACPENSISIAFGQYFLHTFFMYDLQQTITTASLTEIVFFLTPFDIVVVITH